MPNIPSYRLERADFITEMEVFRILDALRAAATGLDAHCQPSS